MKPTGVAASYHYALAVLAPEGRVNLKLSGLQKQSLQGDSVLVGMMRQFGVQTQLVENGILLSKPEKTNLKTFEYDFINCPDLAQTVTVLCAALNIPAKFYGLTTLSIKETDRTAALSTELAKIGRTVFGQ